MGEREEAYDIAVVGGGLGGVAAALAACERGMRVLLSEPTEWLGGQMTSQGTSALDEHPHIEAFGGSRRYLELRERIRDHYRRRYGVIAMPDGSPLNPGGAWVSDLCFEPAVGAAALDAMLAPDLAAGRLTVLRGYAADAADLSDPDTVARVRLVPVGTGGEAIWVRARLFLDATELGDLLPLAGAEHVTGAESREDTGEPFLPDGPARPGEVQSFTVCFAVEHRPGEDHTVPRPEGYAELRDRQPYTLTLAHRAGPPREFRVFEAGPTGLPPFWTYRRLLDAALLDPGGPTRDIALINWPGNDYRFGDIVGASPEERVRLVGEARRLSLGFLHWLQTECPRDDGSGLGYPGLRLLPEVMGTADGLAMAPYVRESRRIVARRRILATDILAALQPDARARSWPDSVGVGWYHMDVHPACGNPRDIFEPTRPFQVPLGALVPVRVRNLLACCKNIGTTHLSNGAYRLHPVEWTIGEAAGRLAAMCCAEGLAPAEVCESQERTRELQRALIQGGCPVAWAVDVPPGAAHFAATQLLILAGAIAPGGPRAASLEVWPGEPLEGPDRDSCHAAMAALGVRAPDPGDSIATWADSCRAVEGALGLG